MSRYWATWDSRRRIAQSVLNNADARRRQMCLRLPHGTRRASLWLVSVQSLPEVSVIALTEPADAVPPESAAEVPVESEPSELIAGTYRVAGSIGAGAMGVVYLAVDVRLSRPVALKLIREQLHQPGFKILFREEARAMALVNHPNVVTIYSFGEHDGRPYLAMEFVQGRSLDRLLDDRRGQLDIDLALSLLDQACLGLSAIHESGAVHRDIKPSNLLVDQQNRLRICDLGLATSYREGVSHREVVGTPGYIAPEIVLGQSDATPRSDVYSLACVAYELLTGHPPFRPTPDEVAGVQYVARTIAPPSTMRPGLPAVFDGVLGAALAEDPRRRTGSAERFRQALIDAHSATFDPARILIVEDDPDGRLVLALALETEFPNAEIDSAEDGAAALRAFSKHPPSVVVSDLQMPGTDGFALTTELRSRSDANGVPIILLTASGGPQEWRRLSGLGADGFVVKPANMEDLAGTIRRALRQRRTRAPV
jgi:serine/threonine protein kinase